MDYETPETADRVLNRFPDLNIGVLGDMALDGYWIEAPEAAVPSLETGLPTRPVRTQRYAPGAAANVARNLEALGCGRVHLFGVVGADPWGAELRRLLDSPRMDTRGLYEQRDRWATVAYIKPHVAESEQARWDFGDFNQLAEETADAVIERLDAEWPRLDALFLNVQARSGIHTGYLRDKLSARIAAQPGRICVLDSREPEALYPGCVLKLNAAEAARLCGGTAEPDIEPTLPDAAAWAKKLYARQQNPVFVTAGRRGIAAHDESGASSVAGIESPDPVDPTGAGDAVAAAVTAGLAAGAGAAAAAALGNLAAAISVRKLRRTGTATPAEIRALLFER